MDKIKLPIEWHDLAEEFLDADGQIITIDRITEALNTAADKDRQIAVLTERVDKLRDIITKAIKLTHETWTCRGLSEVLLADTTALAESKRIQEGE